MSLVPLPQFYWGSECLKEWNLSVPAYVHGEACTPRYPVFSPFFLNHEMSSWSFSLSPLSAAAPPLPLSYSSYRATCQMGVRNFRFYHFLPLNVLETELQMES